MLTLTSREDRTGQRHYIGRVILSDGTIAGEGYAGSPANALYFAAVDARDAGHPAGRYFARMSDGNRLAEAVPEDARSYAAKIA